MEKIKYEGNRIRIAQKGNLSTVEIDGIDIRGLCEINYHISVDSLPTLELRMYVGDIEIDIDSMEDL